MNKIDAGDMIQTLGCGCVFLLTIISIGVTIGFWVVVIWLLIQIGHSL